ncbi:unnamed protein product [Adineta steineri]|uniref:Uncharacterized protein n=1 Tax=Adineta steineri TaxID=433720 RepID=A0A814GG59_9BILA|nr:unnamed protein product [Adineta steineri]CAF3917107.1 unnamed protein product [Adineta steineri]
MKMPLPKSTLLCTTYIHYLSDYRSSTWSNMATFPPNIQQDQIDPCPILDFNCVSQDTLDRTESTGDAQEKKAHSRKLQFVEKLEARKLQIWNSLNSAQERIHILTIMTQIDETQPKIGASKYKSKRKQPTDVS